MKKPIAVATLALMLTVLGAVRAAAAPSDEIRSIIITAGDSLKFDITHIEAKPGERIRLQLRNTSTLPKEVMGHNWVLLRAGQDATAYANTAMTAKDDNYQPKALVGEVYAAIPLVGPHQTGEVEFTAPVTPGHYVYLCSFPAHCLAGMRGELVVK